MTLDEELPPEHAVRELDAILSLVDWAPWESKYHQRIGQPPIHPRLVAGAIFYGLVMKIRSSRQLEDATRERRDFRWFLEGRTIDHATFANFRNRFSEQLKGLNDEISLKLVELSTGGKHQALELILDGTRIRANSDRHGARSAETLQRLIGQCCQEMARRLELLGQQDVQDEQDRTTIAGLEQQLAQLEQELAQSRQEADRLKAKLEPKRGAKVSKEGTPGSPPSCPPASDAKAPEAADSNAARRTGESSGPLATAAQTSPSPSGDDLPSDESPIATGDDPPSDKPVCAADSVSPQAPESASIEENLKALKKQVKQAQQYGVALETAIHRDKVKVEKGKGGNRTRVPVSDPESSIMPNKEGGYAPNYTPVVAMDSLSGAILWFQVLSGNDEAQTVLPAVKDCESALGRTPERVLADGNFCAGKALEALEELEIDAYIPAGEQRDNPARRADLRQPMAAADIARLALTNKAFSTSAFIYQADEDCYYCPMGQRLEFRQMTTNNRMEGPLRAYRCPGVAKCPLAEQCVRSKKDYRVLLRDQYQDHRDRVNARMASEAGQAIYKNRAPRVEGTIGSIKQSMGVRQFLLRGREKVTGEMGWICGAFNLKKLMRRVAPNCFDPPSRSRRKRQSAGRGGGSRGQVGGEGSRGQVGGEGSRGQIGSDSLIACPC